MTKEELRQKYKLKRQSLSQAEYDRLNLKLCDTFFKHIDLANLGVIHTFLPIEKNKEPDTWLIIRRIQVEFPVIRIAVPRVNPVTSEFDSVYFEGPDQLKPNNWGIPEPVGGVLTPAEQIDGVVVPLLTFDTNGHRVGYGKGYYDKFLVRCKDAVKIGLSLFPPESPFGSGVHDIALNLAITPDKVYYF